MMKPFLGDVEKKLAGAMAEQDKEMGTKNIAYLIRRTKRFKPGTTEIEDVCEMVYVDIEGYTGIDADPKQEYAMKAFFVKDGKPVEGFPLGKNIRQGIDSIFTNVTSNKDDNDD